MRPQGKQSHPGLRVTNQFRSTEYKTERPSQESRGMALLKKYARDTAGPGHGLTPE